MGCSATCVTFDEIACKTPESCSRHLPSPLSTSVCSGKCEVKLEVLSVLDSTPAAWDGKPILYELLGKCRENVTEEIAEERSKCAVRQGVFEVRNAIGAYSRCAVCSFRKDKKEKYGWVANSSEMKCWADNTSEVSVKNLVEEWAPGTKLESLSGASIPSYVSTFFGNTALMSLRLDMSATDYETMASTPKTFVKCSLVLGLSGGEETWTQVGCRTKGASTLKSAMSDYCGSTAGVRFPLKVDLNEFVRDQDAHGLSKFVLNAGMKDATFGLQEWAAYELYRLTGQPAPRTRFVDATVAGEKLGVYLLVEAVDRWSFLKQHFSMLNTDAASMYKPESFSCTSSGLASPRRSSRDEQIEDAECANLDLSGPSSSTSTSLPNSTVMLAVGGAFLVLALMMCAVMCCILCCPNCCRCCCPRAARTADQSSQGDLKESMLRRLCKRRGVLAAFMVALAFFIVGVVVLSLGAAATSCSSGGLNGGEEVAAVDMSAPCAERIALDDSYGVQKGNNHTYFAELLQLVDANASPLQIAQRLDVESVLRYLATTAILAEWDSIAGSLAHNIYLVDPDGSGRFHAVSWDHNEAFGHFARCSCGSNPRSSLRLWESCGASMPITKQLLGEGSPFRRRYWEHVKDVAASLPELRRLLGMMTAEVRKGLSETQFESFDDASSALQAFLSTREAVVVSEADAELSGAPLKLLTCSSCLTVP
eukprot:TRINITY_DN4896_c0_g1_i5.p1 TRINITY_DN4896_c0_g1~~TRINITY_DN4896_c0_g1_i5.p1  ORF type:complete len:732 (-),score=91.31 TRINITY_DN4896_c0_g1_i5:392-2512(-)